jgi:hypothetical protein
VKWTQADHLAPLPFQTDVFAHNVNDIIRLLHSGDGSVVVYPRHKYLCKSFLNVPSVEILHFAAARIEVRIPPRRSSKMLSYLYIGGKRPKVKSGGENRISYIDKTHFARFGHLVK